MSLSERFLPPRFNQVVVDLSWLIDAEEALNSIFVTHIHFLCDDPANICQTLNHKEYSCKNQNSICSTKLFAFRRWMIFNKTIYFQA